MSKLLKGSSFVSVLKFVCLIILIIVSAFALLWSLCSPSNSNLSKEERHVIAAVLLHGSDQYSVIMTGDGAEMFNHDVSNYTIRWAEQHGFTIGSGGVLTPEVRLYADVPSDAEEYLLLRGKGAGVTAEIHVRNLRTIGGAGWLTEGKNPTEPRGRTVPLTPE
jgi:hypothetical protein